MTTLADQRIASIRKGPKDPNAFMGCGIGMDVRIPQSTPQLGENRGPKDPNRFVGSGIGMDSILKKGKFTFGLVKPIESNVQVKALKDAERICEEMQRVLKGLQQQAKELYCLKQYAAYLADRLHTDVRNVKFLNNVVGRAVDFTTMKGDQVAWQLSLESQVLTQKIETDSLEALQLARKLASDLEAQTFGINSAMLKTKLVSADRNFANLQKSLKNLRQVLTV